MILQKSFQYADLPLKTFLIINNFENSFSANYFFVTNYDTFSRLFYK